MKTIFIVTFLLVNVAAFAQHTVANAHAHNDYNHPQPFYTAYNAGFGSIEADIFLVDGQLYVAHNAADIRSERTLAALYLDPLRKKADSLKPLLLLIDIKTAAKPTLAALVKLLDQYKELTSYRALKIVISGNRPANLSFYPAWLYFDGRPGEQYQSPDKIALISDNFGKYSSWKGEGPLPEADRKKLESVIAAAHQLKKPMRFWATPDNENAWRVLVKLKVDYINTDKIQELANFLSTYNR
jgi:alkaline phosphatase